MIDGINLEAERDILSIFLNAPEMVLEHADKVRSDLFYDPFHKKLITKIRSNILENKPIDISTLSNSKQEQKAISTLKDLEREYESFSTLYSILEEGMIARNLSGLVIKTEQRLSGDPDSIIPSTVMHKLRAELDTMEQLRSTSIFSISEIVNKVVDRHLDIYQHVQDGEEYTKDNVVSTPFATLNAMLKRGGLSGGDLIIVAAPTSTGKTELALNIAAFSAIDEKKKTFIYSLEMTKESLVERILLERSKVDSFKLERGIINEVDISRLQTAATLIKNSEMFFEDNQSGDIFDLITSIRKAHYKYGLDLVIIDYVQLISNPASTGSRNDEVSSITRLLKREATNLNIPIVALSQLSRKHLLEGREPALYDLRDSGAIEQDADTVLMLYATNKERKNTVQTKTKCILAKQREGSIGELFLMNHKTIQTFAEITALDYKKGQKESVEDRLNEDKDEQDLPF